MSALLQHLGKSLASRFVQGNRHTGIQPFATIKKGQYSWPEVDEKDIKVKYMKGGGPGGQAVAKANNCVVVKHIPTGIIVRAHDTRSGSENHKIAIERLKYHLDIHYNKENSFDAINKQQGSINRAKDKAKARALLEKKKKLKERKE